MHTEKTELRFSSKQNQLPSEELKADQVLLFAAWLILRTLLSLILEFRGEPLQVYHKYLHQRLDSPPVWHKHIRYLFHFTW
jgi:hypothetical protein